MPILAIKRALKKFRRTLAQSIHGESKSFYYKFIEPCGRIEGGGGHEGGLRGVRVRFERKKPIPRSFEQIK